jgi:AcrR family transcriptional regulator
MSAINVKHAALKLFALKGYEATTMRDIGKEAGIKASSIYAHFESKEALFLTTVSEVVQRVNWELNDHDLDNGMDLREMLYNIFISYYDFFSNHKLELRFWQRIRFFPPVGLENKYDLNKIGSQRPLLELYIELFTRSLGGITPTHPVEMYVMSYFSFISGYTDSLLIVPFNLNLSQLNHAFDIYWTGLNW